MSAGKYTVLYRIVFLQCWLTFAKTRRSAFLCLCDPTLSTKS